MSTEIVVADIGGTHVRFAIAEIDAGQVERLHDSVTFRVDQFTGLRQAWEAFGTRLDRSLPRHAAVALAVTIGGEELHMTNNPWIIRPAMLQDELGLDRMMLMNDFGAVAHAVAHFGREHFVHVCGPEVDLPAIGTISVVGPGTGLGVAGLLRSKDHYHVLETEGGHIEFAALDTIEEAIVTRLRARHGRVSAERIVSGSGLQTIYEVLAERDGEAVAPVSNPELWQRALDSHSPLATEALERFCRSLGSIAGDIALVHGASALVIAGGLGLRLAKSIKGSGFAGRFLEKGRYLSLMETIPVHLVTHTQPGLFGAAAAFAASSTDGASGY